VYPSKERTRQMPKARDRGTLPNVKQLKRVTELSLLVYCGTYPVFVIWFWSVHSFLSSQCAGTNAKSHCICENVDCTKITLDVDPVFPTAFHKKQKLVKLTRQQRAVCTDTSLLILFCSIGRCGMCFVGFADALCSFSFRERSSRLSSPIASSFSSHQYSMD